MASHPTASPRYDIHYAPSWPADQTYSLVEQTKLVTGDVAEFGVFRAGSFAGLVAAAYKYGKIGHAFDSFQGAPPDVVARLGLASAHNVGGPEVFHELMRRAHLTPPIYQLWPGWIPESFATVPPELRLALALIDLGYDDATAAALAFAWERLSEGGIIAVALQDSVLPGAVRAFLHDRANVRVTCYVESQILLQKKAGATATLPEPRPARPCKGAATTLEWFASQQNLPPGAQYLPIVPQHECFLPEPHTVGLRRRYHFAECYVATLPKGRVLGESAAVIAPDRTILHDVSMGRWVLPGVRHRNIYPSFVLPPLQQVAGDVATISIYLPSNYWCFLHNTVPRLELLRRSGISVDAIVANVDHDWQREAYDVLGVKNIIPARPDLYLEAERLIVPSLPGNFLFSPKWVSDWLRDAFLKEKAEQRIPGIYLSRRKAAHRQILNEEEFEKVMADYGIETVYPEDYGMVEKAKLFNSADLVIFPITSGAANLMFCEPGTPVIEIFPPRYLLPGEAVLSMQMGLPYFHMYGIHDERCLRPSDMVDAEAHDDLVVDLDELRRTLDRAVAARGRRSA